MIEKPLNIEDNETLDAVKHIFRNAQGNIIALESAPTASAPLLQDNELGVYGTTIYHRVGNTIYSFNSDSQITIT